MPAIPRPDILSREALQASVDRAVHGRLTLSEVFSEVDSILGAAGRAAGTVAASDAGAASVALAEDAGAGLADSFGILLTLAALCVLVLARRVHDTERDIIGKIPWVGGHLQVLVDIQFPFIDQVEGWIVDQLEHQTRELLTGFSKAVWWVLTGGTGGIPNPTTDLIRSYVDPVHREADHLWAWVQDISERLDDVQATTHGTPQPAPGVHLSLPERLSTLQAQIDTLDHRVSGVQHELAGVQAANAVQAEQITHLQHVLYGARAATIGAQDVFHRLDVIEQGILHTQAQQSTELAAHTSALAALEPLMVLLPAGARGLENLTKLEENPCQCSGLPRLGFQLPDALGIYEFITAG